MNNPYISDLKLPTNYIEKVIADIDNDVYSDSIVKLDVNSIKIGTVLGLHAIIKREVKVASAVLLTLCDIQRAANNIKCTATNISRAIEKCKKLRGGTTKSHNTLKHETAKKQSSTMPIKRFIFNYLYILL